MKIYSKKHRSQKAAEGHMLKLLSGGAVVLKENSNDGTTTLKYVFFDDSLIGKTITVLKPMYILQEQEYGGADRVFCEPKTKLVIKRIDYTNRYFYAKNDIANLKDYIDHPKYRFKVNKRPYILGFTELTEMLCEKLVKIV